MNLTIGSRRIGPGEPCFIIAEVGLAHDGSLSQAHAYVDAAARAGVDAVKFQCHIGDQTSEWRVKPAWPQDEDRQAYWRRTSFTQAQWDGLARHCNDVGLTFLCSPFSVSAVYLLSPIVPAWKVPSGRVTNAALLDAIGATKKPVLLQGMSSGRCQAGCAWGRLHRNDARVRARTPPSGLVLDAVEGLSDHSGTIYPGIAAAALGCQVLEVHVCWSKDQGGFDTAASITTAQLGELVRGVRFVEQAMRPVDKDLMASHLVDVRRGGMGEDSESGSLRHCARLARILA
jgi:N-acetylneuraminate synthase